jgi:uncharacterized membrane-anchored protein YhcB (DUF1043 family)
MQEVEESNAVRTILRSEITWLVSFIALIMGFVSTVVLPLQSLQIQLTSVQGEVVKNGLHFDKLEERVSTVEKQTAKLMK